MRCHEADLLRWKWYAAAEQVEWDDGGLALHLVEEARKSLAYQKWFTELYCHMKNCATCRQIMRELTAAAQAAEMPELEGIDD